MTPPLGGAFGPYYTVGEVDDHDEVVPIVPSDQPFVPPTAVERELCAALADGDTGSYLRVLATVGAYHPVALVHAHRDPAKRQVVTSRLGDGRTATFVYTQDMLPRPHPYLVYEFASIRTLAEIVPAEVEVLAVNANTPCELYLEVTDHDRERWKEAHERRDAPGLGGHRVVTRHSTGCEPTELLHGLACGAHLCYLNGDAWNNLDWHGLGYSGEVERLAEGWGVEARQDWITLQNRLLNCDVSTSDWDFVLGARNFLLSTEGPLVGPQRWRECVDTTIRNNIAANVPGASAERGGSPEVDSYADFLCGLVGTIVRYEARFRADELLPPDGYVRTVAAWDLGRASTMARWGRGARYATQAEMYEALDLVSRETRSRYGSWAEFSVGYVLGRCLHFDDEAFGPTYTDVLEAHRALLAEGDSPWRAVPFHLPE
ncbi:DUF1266 domain-containing protein [Saccharopolyspora rhizosphaerae]|uniref:DUF1266 domain-containing protein n=1 Tax=Saccharopolyspora rhizosphaerae TaxID=2492662 RepID=A0A426JVY3_9PSEU|nr:DUF1266 domain-containing protein [Saccharopolyspora rhizosphaerae]RRO17241.1 DUF1266 domain-containing protein [Saccharopolyspora rhizosphaerae]